jgi:outer membrane protein TolC
MLEIRFLSTTALALLATVVFSQGLTLEQALDMAKSNNGAVQAAFLQYEASKANAKSAYSSFYPSLIPSYQYESSRLDNFTGPGQGVFRNADNSSSITASWLLADSGERTASYKSSVFNRDASEKSALQSLRQTLFAVHSRFSESLRADELLKVSQTQLTRAEEIEKQSQAFADSGAGAGKDVLQARADALNAKAGELSARNRVTDASASLKAILGIDTREELPPLVRAQE